MGKSPVNGAKQVEALYNFLLHEAEESLGMVPGLDPERELVPAAASHIDCMVLASSDPFFKHRLDQARAALNKSDSFHAMELAICLALEDISLDELRWAGYEQAALEELQRQIPPLDIVGRSGLLCEILSIVQEQIIDPLISLMGKIAAATAEAEAKVQTESKVEGATSPHDMRRAKRSLKSFNKKLANFEADLSENSEEAVFIQRSFYRASATQRGKYRSPGTQLGWLQRRVTLLRVEIEQILKQAPRRGEKADQSLSGEVGHAVVDSHHQRIALSLAWAWTEWVGKPPARTTRQISDDGSSAEGGVPTRPDGPFLKIVQILLRPTVLQKQTFDAVVRNAMDAVKELYPLRSRHEMDD